MASYLRGLAYFLLVAGVIIGVACAFWAWHDEAYFKAAEALSRHQDHVLFQAEYYAALARHLAYIITALFAGIGGVVSSAILFGLSAVLQKLDRERSYTR